VISRLAIGLQKEICERMREMFAALLRWKRCYRCNRCRP